MKRTHVYSDGTVSVKSFSEQNRLKHFYSYILAARRLIVIVRTIRNEPVRKAENFAKNPVTKIGIYIYKC